MNPSRPAKSFLTRKLTKSFEQHFSPNCIQISIQGPGLQNLAFYDLPGVIQQTERDGEDYLVNIVKNLVKEYVADENALIILACSLENDVHTSTAFSIVKSMGARDRCIGVLTKPDRIASGVSSNIWAGMLAGEKFSLRHGWFVTKQPGHTDRGMTYEEARNSEHVFFDTKKPWNGDLAEFKHLFGTSALQEAVSAKLVQQIRHTIPVMDEKLATKMADLSAELLKYPQPPTMEAVHIVHDCIVTFSTTVQDFIRGKYPHNEFRKEWKKLKDQYTVAMVELRPRLQPVSRQDEKLAAVGQLLSPSKRKYAVVVSDDDDEPVTPTPAARNMQQGARVKVNGTANSNTGGLGGTANGRANIKANGASPTKPQSSQPAKGESPGCALV